MKRRSRDTAASRKREAAKALEKTLRRTGYTDLKARGVKPLRPPLPDLSVRPPTAPLSNGVGNGLAAPPIPDAKQFTVGHFHKQGYQLVSRDDVKFMASKSTGWDEKQ